MENLPWQEGEEVKTHIHKYKRVKLGKDKTFITYRCMLPDCSHYIEQKLVVGRKSLCWKCDEPVIITKDKNGVQARPTHRPYCPGKENLVEQNEIVKESVEDMMRRLGL